MNGLERIQPAVLTPEVNSLPQCSARRIRRPAKFQVGSRCTRATAICQSASIAGGMAENDCQSIPLSRSLSVAAHKRSGQIEPPNLT